jgi:hypothetical protein
MKIGTLRKMVPNLKKKMTRLKNHNGMKRMELRLRPKTKSHTRTTKMGLRIRQMTARMELRIRLKTTKMELRIRLKTTRMEQRIRIKSLSSHTRLEPQMIPKKKSRTRTTRMEP